MPRDFSLAEFCKLFSRSRLSSFKLNGGQHLLAIFFIVYSDNLHIDNFGMREKKFFEFAGINIFTAPDDHVFDASGYFEITVFVYFSQIAGMQPLVSVNGVGRGLGHFVVAFHHAGAPGDNFALSIRRQINAHIRVNNFSFDIRKKPSHGGNTQFDRIVTSRHRHHRCGFRLAEGNNNFGTMHFRAHLIHRFDGAGSPGHNARAQRRHVVFIEVGMIQNRDKHRRHAVNRRALLRGNKLHSLERIKIFHNDHGRAAVNAIKRAHHTTETMKKRHLNQQTVFLRHAHDISDHPGVVDNIVMSQHDPFRKTCGARSVLHIDDIIIGKRIHPVIQLLFGDFLSHFDQIGKFKHAGRGFFFADIDHVF